MDLREVIHSVETAARDSRSRLISFLAARAGGDVAGAEDALSEAFVAALEQWPVEGVPQKPEAWLLTIARRRLLDAQRRGRTRINAVDSISHAMETARSEMESDYDFPDERLKLLFVCAHPAIDPAARTPLMMQTVMGIEAERIADVFLCSPAAMSQRLVRAKVKIRDAGIPFAVPAREEWPERLGFVLDAVYAAYTTGWDSGECVWFARVLAHLLPEEPEVLGLLALILHGHARRDARNCDGKYVPLTEQETSLWDQESMDQAETMLRRAAGLLTPGRFQLEAAIQSVHAARAVTGVVNWQAIAGFYDVLVHHTPALGARIGRAIAHARWRGSETGLQMLDELPKDALLTHQPYWAAKANLLAETARKDEARAAFTRAIGLCDDSAMRAYLSAKLHALDE
jgi:RNA polymerase sigma-70 factor (ECF subfamily)